MDAAASISHDRGGKETPMNEPEAAAAETLDELRAELAAAEAVMAKQEARQLIGETVWKRKDSPIMVSSDVHIPPGSSLTIEPGVLVLFAPVTEQNGGATMHVSGELFAEGTATERILLTSMGDPEITPGRASATSPLALDRESRPPQPLVHWPSMRTNASWFKLSYVDIRYAGPIDHRFVASIHVNTTGRFEMDNSTIKYGMSDGLQIGYSPDAEAMTVSRSVISDNGGKGISVYEGYVDVRYGTVVMGNGGSGIYN
jgi:hypothetical protein